MGATAVLHCMSLNMSACQVAQHSSHPSLPVQHHLLHWQYCSADSIWDFLPQHRQAEALLYQLATTAAWTTKHNRACRTALQGHSRTSTGKGSLGVKEDRFMLQSQETCCKQKKNDFGLTESVPLLSWSLLSYTSTRVVFSRQGIVPESEQK